ncbi:MAG: hypothetical protein JNG86_03965 [Verrucomicrobiaceae bacterium]|nr:hypothetical protein [Verrucomicrobiaceae bacterium]
MKPLLFALLLFVASTHAVDLHVLAIGVEPELAAKGKNDPYARDAGHIAQALKAAETLYSRVNLRVIGGAEARKAAVTAALDELANNMHANDVALIHFSTHGSIDAKGMFVITLAKPGPRTPAEGITRREINSIVSRMRGTVLVTLDTCASAGVFPERAVPRASYLVACGAQESSYGDGDSRQRPHGHFITAFCEALRGRADADGNGQVSFGELADYLPGRTTEICSEQHAETQIKDAHRAVVLAKTAGGVKPEKIVADGSRNPFGLPDVDKPLAQDVRKFFNETKLPPPAQAANAEDWATFTAPRATGIDGRWQSRWDYGDGNWANGTAIIKTVGERVYISFFSADGRYLIETRRLNERMLGGRYMNVTDTGDNSPMKLRIVSDDRIDGVWSGGRWDFRRKAE